MKKAPQAQKEPEAPAQLPKEVEPIVVEEKLEVEKDIITEIPEEEAIKTKAETTVDLSGWQPKTSFKQLVRLMVDADMALAEKED